MDLSINGEEIRKEASSFSTSSQHASILKEPARVEIPEKMTARLAARKEHWINITRKLTETSARALTAGTIRLFFPEKEI